MPHVTDWEELGAFPLQDHDKSVAVDMRQMLVGFRAKGPVGEEDWRTAVAKDSAGMGTVGDLHPWRYWGVSNRSDRGMGSWAMAFATVLGAPGDDLEKPITPSEGFRPGDEIKSPTRGTASLAAYPIRDGDYEGDWRYRPVNHELPPFIGPWPSGTLAIAMAGTEETEQHDLLMHADPRLIVPNAHPEGAMGTRACDLGPPNAISVIRTARLQSTWRVLRMPDDLGDVPKLPGNGIAWQLTASQQDRLAGYGLTYGLPDTSGGEGGDGPTTPSEQDRPDAPTITPTEHDRIASERDLRKIIGAIGAGIVTGGATQIAR